MTRAVLNRALAMTVALLLGSTAAVSADSITVFSDLRSTVAGASPHLGPSPDNRVASAPASDAMTAVAIASSGLSSGASAAALASSYADPMRWSGSGSADIDWTTQSEGLYNARSAFLVSFHVGSPVTYAFNSTLNASSGDRSIGNLFAIFGNTRSGFIFNSLTLLESNESATLAPIFSGLLLPGDYFLNVGSLVQGTAGTSVAVTSASHAAFAFAMDFAAADVPAATPEPASLVLLGTGLVGMVGRRWTRRRRRTPPM